MQKKRLGRPRRGEEKPLPVPKKIMNPHDLKDHMVKSEMDGKPPAEVHVSKKLHETLKMDPWWGDNGEVQTFHGVVVKLSDEPGFTVRIVPKKEGFLDADI